MIKKKMGKKNRTRQVKHREIPVDVPPPLESSGDHPPVQNENDVIFGWSGLVRFILVLIVMMFAWMKMYASMFTIDSLFNVVNQCASSEPIETKLYPPFPYTYQFCADSNDVMFSKRVRLLREACMHLKGKSALRQTGPLAVSGGNDVISSKTQDAADPPAFLLGPEYGINMWIAYDSEWNQCLVNPVQVIGEENEPNMPPRKPSSSQVKEGEKPSFWNRVQRMAKGNIPGFGLDTDSPEELFASSTSSLLKCAYVIPVSSRRAATASWMTLLIDSVSSPSSASSSRKRKNKKPPTYGVVEVTRTSPVTIVYLDENLVPGKRTYYGDRVCHIHSFLRLNDEFSTSPWSRFGQIMRSFKPIQDGHIVKRRNEENDDDDDENDF